MISSWSKIVAMAVLWALILSVSYYIKVMEPNDVIVSAAKEKIKSNEPLRQDQRLYAEALIKIKSNKCEVVQDENKDNFFKCPDGSTISQIKWERNNRERTGIVTRYYDSTGKLLLIYGHPDDTN